MHYDFDGFFKRRRFNMFKMREDGLKELQAAQAKEAKYRRKAGAALAKGKPDGKKAPKTTQQVLTGARERQAMMVMELFELRVRVGMHACCY